LGDIQLFDVKLTTVSRRRIENATAGQPNNMSATASPDYQGTGKLAEQFML
jgi:hypothetical protein